MIKDDYQLLIQYYIIERMCNTNLVFSENTAACLLILCTNDRCSLGTSRSSQRTVQCKATINSIACSLACLFKAVKCREAIRFLCHGRVPYPRYATSINRSPRFSKPHVHSHAGYPKLPSLHHTPQHFEPVVVNACYQIAARPSRCPFSLDSFQQATR